MFKEIANFTEVNKNLDDISAQIMEKIIFLATLQEEYLTAKATWENIKARYLLETKAKNPNFIQSEVVAMSIMLSHNEKLNLIKAESTYKKCLNEIRALRDKLDSLKEISFNIRAESRI